MAHVIELYTCADKGQPMLYQTEVQAIANVGLKGDRYASGLGAWSKEKNPKIRHVTLIDVADLERANIELEIKGLVPFLAGETRRNIVTSGIDMCALLALEFSIGEVMFRGIEHADPCDRPTAITRKQGFKEAFRGRGGLRAEVLTSGIIRIGDEVSR